MPTSKNATEDTCRQPFRIPLYADRPTRPSPRATPKNKKINTVDTVAENPQHQHSQTSPLKSRLTRQRPTGILPLPPHLDARRMPLILPLMERIALPPALGPTLGPAVDTAPPVTQPLVVFHAVPVVTVRRLVDRSHVHVADRVVAVKDARDLFEGGTLGLDVKDVDKDELEYVPDGVEEHEVPMVREVVPGQFVGLAVDGRSAWSGLGGG